MTKQKYMFCQNCGKKVKIGTRFCPRCGHKIPSLNKNQMSNNNKGSRHKQVSRQGQQNINQNNKSRKSKTTNQPIHRQPDSQTQQPNQSYNHRIQTHPKATAQNSMNNLLNMKQDTEHEEVENARKEESLNLQERSYIDNKVANHAPSTVVCYLLGIFLFEFGAPQWYLHHYIGGVIALICTFILGWIFGLGFVIEFIWGIVDLFLYPLFVRHAKAKIKRQAINEVIMMRH